MNVRFDVCPVSSVEECQANRNRSITSTGCPLEWDQHRLSEKSQLSVRARWQVLQHSLPSLTLAHPLAGNMVRDGHWKLFGGRSLTFKIGCAIQKKKAFGDTDIQTRTLTLYAFAGRSFTNQLWHENIWSDRGSSQNKTHPGSSFKIKIG